MTESPSFSPPGRVRHAFIFGWQRAELLLLFAVFPMPAPCEAGGFQQAVVINLFDAYIQYYSMTSLAGCWSIQSRSKDFVYALYVWVTKHDDNKWTHSLLFYYITRKKRIKVFIMPIMYSTLGQWLHHYKQCSQGGKKCLLKRNYKF